MHTRMHTHAYTHACIMACAMHACGGRRGRGGKGMHCSLCIPCAAAPCAAAPCTAAVPVLRSAPRSALASAAPASRPPPPHPRMPWTLDAGRWTLYPVPRPPPAGRRLLPVPLRPAPLLPAPLLPSRLLWPFRRRAVGRTSPRG